MNCNCTGTTKVFLVVALGILLGMLGLGLDSMWLCLVGSFLFTASLFAGGLLSTENAVPTRVAMLVIAGLAAYGMFYVYPLLPA